MSDRNDTRDEPTTDEARRRLLKMALYVPPAILGVVSVTQAACQNASSPDCPPDTGPPPCPPNR
jgi:hypothetical protein